MFYCTLSLSEEEYEKIKDLPEIRGMAQEIYPSNLGLVELCSYTGDCIVAAEQVLQERGISYDAFLDENWEGPAIKRSYSIENGVKELEV